MQLHAWRCCLKWAIAAALIGLLAVALHVGAGRSTGVTYRTTQIIHALSESEATRLPEATPPAILRPPPQVARATTPAASSTSSNNSSHDSTDDGQKGAGRAVESDNAASIRKMPNNTESAEHRCRLPAAPFIDHVAVRRSADLAKKLNKDWACTLRCQLFHQIPLGKQVESIVNKTHYQKCAVVGSSGAMLGHSFGKEIDGMDAILRFGLAPSGHEFRDNVGEHETVRVINNWMLKFYVVAPDKVAHEKGLGLLHALGLKKIDHIPDRIIGLVGPTELQNFKKNHPGLYHESLAAALGNIPILDDTTRSNLTAYIHKVFEYKPNHEEHIVSSGMTAILIMMHLCDMVYAYEMVPSPAAAGKNWHYYGNYLGTAVGGHGAVWHDSLGAEQVLWTILAGDLGQSGRLVFRGFRNDPCVQ